MNVLIVINKLGLGGAEHFVLGLSAELCRRGHRVWVAADAGPLAGMLDPRVTWVRCAAHDKSPRGILALARTIADLVAAHGIAVVHANSPTTALAARLASSLPFRARGSRRRVAVIASAHGVWRDRVKAGVALMFSLGADSVVGCSDFIRRDLQRRGLLAREVRTIHNGVPQPDAPADPACRPAVRAECGLPPDAPLVVTAARLADQKGLHHLLAAFPAVRARVPGAALLVAGEGERRADLEREARDLGLDGAVRFLGRRDDVSRLLAAADVFCLPSLSEGLPLAIAEAMAAGLPVVATPVGGVPEIVQDGETGFLVPPGDAGALAARLAALLADARLREQMGAWGRLRASRHFSLERMATRFEALYERHAR
ncbi:MAG: glycosyltransferase [Candidatus Sericytochromatia bacterium]|nr:glycosyltransferase [Candidatus Tanganyikabacteria bacterium]